MGPSPDCMKCEVPDQTIASFIIFSSSLEGLLKVLVLSEVTKEGADLRATYHLKTLKMLGQ